MKIKDFFQLNLALELDLKRMTAPIFVLKGTGMNDDLNWVERPVAFKIRHLQDQELDTIYDVIRRTELFVYHEYPEIKPVLPEKNTFIRKNY